MPRIAEVRAPARPNSAQQRLRVDRILHAAARHGAMHGLDHVQMHEVAKEAGVAIATLYRYFPSKMHLFTGVLRSKVLVLDETFDDEHVVLDPVHEVEQLLLRLTREMLAAPLLAHAMMISNNAALHDTSEEAVEAHVAFSRLVLRTAGITEPTERDQQLGSLIERAWFGELTAALNQHLGQDVIEDDIRVLCALLLREWARD
ncbi:TetR family transcriptional regulator [Nocardioides sp. AE5]|uniref:TetR family transcriptional regulator n=1 Tax=Nocardioides sp. AE5 TaxID=2962573 RepID=UPI0028826919|nr:TetR family transcriptional regulator [Nocardioides sp. AE5]MDT0203145.1 TetR family transcriptional regulator [Nocardioides sp. AE5]